MKTIKLPQEQFAIVDDEAPNAVDVNAELRALADEAYELLWLKLEERAARDEMELLDELVLLQSMQTRLAKGKPLDAWRESLMGWIERSMKRRQRLYNRI